MDAANIFILDIYFLFNCLFSCMLTSIDKDVFFYETKGIGGNGRD